MESTSDNDNDNSDYGYNNGLYNGAAADDDAASGMPYSSNALLLRFWCRRSKISLNILKQFTWNIESTNFHLIYLADDTDEDEDDLDYNGNSSSGSDSIVIKIGSKNASPNNQADNPDANKTSMLEPANGNDSTLAEPNIGPSNTLPSISSSNYNYNGENYYSKDDMSVYDDVNNNRLNLRNNNNGRTNAYEERNIYVANNVLSDSNANDSVKSYIHIEVYKGNLDGTMTAKSKDAKPLTPFDVKSTAKSEPLQPYNGTAWTAQMPTIKP